MKVNNGQVWQARDALAKLIEEKLPIRTSYALAKLAQAIQKEYVVIDQVRTGLVKQYGSADELGNTVIGPSDPTWSEFVTAYEELMNEEVVIELGKIALPDTLSVSASTMLALEPFVEVQSE